MFQKTHTRTRTRTRTCTCTCTCRHYWAHSQTLLEEIGHLLPVERYNIVEIVYTFHHPNSPMAGTYTCTVDCAPIHWQSHHHLTSSGVCMLKFLMITTGLCLLDPSFVGTCHWSMLSSSRSCCGRRERQRGALWTVLYRKREVNVYFFTTLAVNNTLVTYIYTCSLHRITLLDKQPDSEDKEINYWTCV